MLSSSNVNKLASEVGFNSIFSKLQMFNKRVNIQALVIETIPPKDTSSVHIKNTGDNILPVSTLMFRMYKIGIWLTPSNRHPQPFQDIIAYIYVCVFLRMRNTIWKGFGKKSLVLSAIFVSPVQTHVSPCEARPIFQAHFAMKMEYGPILELFPSNPMAWLKQEKHIRACVHKRIHTDAFLSLVYIFILATYIRQNDVTSPTVPWEGWVTARSLRLLWSGGKEQDISNAPSYMYITHISYMLTIHPQNTSHFLISNMYVALLSFTYEMNSVGLVL